MKLLNEDIISSLAHSLKIKESDAEKLLQQWVSGIRDEVEKSGSCQVDGLGTFLSENQKMVFRPDEDLAIEVNYKYAGMNPIEILPAYSRISEQENDSQTGQSSETPDKSQLDQDSTDEQSLDEKKIKTDETTDEIDEFDTTTRTDDSDVDARDEDDGVKDEVDDAKGEDDESSAEISEDNEDDPFALEDEITDDILFGDKPSTSGENADNPITEEDIFDSEDAFDPFAESEEVPDEVDDKEEDPFNVEDDSLSAAENEGFGSRELDSTKKDEVENENEIMDDDPFSEESDIPVSDEESIINRESGPTDDVDKPDDSVYMDEDPFAADEAPSATDEELLEGQTEKSPDSTGSVDTNSEDFTDEEDDSFISEEELFGSTEDEVANEFKAKESDKDKPDIFNKDQEPGDPEQSADEDELKSDSSDEKSPEISPVGKTTGIGIRPPSRKMEKSGKKPGKTQKKEPEPSSVEGNEKKEEKELVDAAIPDSNDKKSKPMSKSKQSGDGSSSYIWLLPIAAALILAVMLFFHFEDQIMDRRGTSQVSEEAVILPPDEQTPGVEEEVTAEDATVMEEETAAPETPADELGEITESAESPYGLMGPEDEILSGAYTIVLHSIANENRARIEKSGLEEEGYKVTIWQAQLQDGRTTWRVGVGQFESVSDAEQVIPELSEPFRSNNFIVRIR